MLAGNGYATTTLAGTIHCGRMVWITQGEGGTVNSVGGKRQFRNNPLALHHTEAIVAWTLREFDAIPE